MICAYFVCPFVGWFVCPFVCLFVCLFVHSPILSFFLFFRKDLGKIRLSFQLFEEQILPWEQYVPLVNLLMETVKKQPYDDVTTLSLLEQVMTADRTVIGRALVKLYLSQGMIVNLLDALTKSEVNNTGGRSIFFHSFGWSKRERQGRLVHGVLQGCDTFVGFFIMMSLFVFFIRRAEGMIYIR